MEEAEVDECRTNERILWYLGEQFFLCYYCMLPIDEKTATRDHVRSQYWGGTLDDGNLVLCCLRCNRTKGPLPYPFFMSLIDGASPPILQKSNRGFGWLHGKKRPGRQQVEVTALWHIRRELKRSGKLKLMPCMEEMAARRLNYLARVQALRDERLTTSSEAGR